MKFVTPQPTTKAPADWFTGDVWFDVICIGQDPSRMRVNMVRFSPGAHTAWHRHAVGQTLHVVEGIALIGTRDGTVFEAHPGETVTCPPDEEHWHGATPDRFMQHLAMWEGTFDDTPETTWLEKVRDEQYGGTRTRGH
ncbi:(R)-mandelonitrile lyase [Streptomyces violaceusniger]|uniref:Cupin 2 conserved barrel domain protein n=1 Tax=Streptomyces violaceusniger (strain Tu 4113) TaxID=653045 RepID=G2PG93_STRV4|nr:cupin domain-containing protein [Streptomyces violaceusniger]AEM85472.1 Cupin 2 conserved barrel domain protein [Streptomyces violaceusniger Tu 4113]